MPHILDLPVEVLQLIADYPIDLTIIRLVCKTFDAAFLDTFGREYLADMHCFMLDPQRLARMKCITSQQHLVRRIQRLSLSFDVLEGKNYSNIDFVAHDFRTESRGSNEFSTISDLWVQPAVKYYKHRVPDQALLRSILEDMRASQRPYIVLDLSGYRSVKSLYSDDYIRLSHIEVGSIFATALVAGCKIQEIKVHENGFLHAALDRQEVSLHDRFLTFCQSLESVDIASLGKHGSPNWELTSMVTAARGLQTLSVEEIGHCGCPGMVPSGQCLQSSITTNPLVLAQANNALCYVELTDVALHPSILLTALQSWKQSLLHLAMCGVYLQSYGYEWLEIFRCLYSSPGLEYIDVGSLADEKRNCQPPDGRKRNGVVVLRDSDGRRKDNIIVHGRQDVQRALLLNIEAGMHETLFYYDNE